MSVEVEGYGSVDIRAVDEGSSHLQASENFGARQTEGIARSHGDDGEWGMAVSAIIERSGGAARRAQPGS
jgi:hypothetical protein